MLFLNKTQYRTRPLRKIVLWCLKHDGWTPEERDSFIIDIIYHNPFYPQRWAHYPPEYRISGLAFLGRKRVWLLVPEPFISRDHFAQVMLHELGHCRWLDHPDMLNSFKLDVSGVETAHDKPYLTVRKLRPKPRLVIKPIAASSRNSKFGIMGTGLGQIPDAFREDQGQ